jgi:hypothetical protein
MCRMLISFEILEYSLDAPHIRAYDALLELYVPIVGRSLLWQRPCILGHKVHQEPRRTRRILGLYVVIVVAFVVVVVILH